MRLLVNNYFLLVDQRSFSRKRIIKLIKLIVTLRDIFKDLQKRWFNSIVSKRLVYNTCWEDPRIDRELLQIDSDSRIVMLTSAGCNAFDYLLDDPHSIYCIDSNPSQNALLEFKKSLFRHGDYETLWKFFGKGYHQQASYIYQQHLAKYLSEPSRLFWEQNINYFTRNANEPSFYFRGSSGKVALMVRNRIKRKGLYKSLLKLLHSKSLPEQTYYFEEVEEQLWNTFYKWLMSRNTTMALLGVPASQRNLIEAEFEEGLVGFIRSSIRHVFTRLPVHDNYFWKVYLTGSYSPTCSPNYLKKEYFRTLKDRFNRINHYTGYLSQFLKQNTDKYTHFVLLDHQDWLANTHPDLLEEEWKLILRNAHPGARVLFRSAGTTTNFVPDFVFDHVDFNPESVQKLHIKDRVGTYGSTHLGIVK